LQAALGDAGPTGLVDEDVRSGAGGKNGIAAFARCHVGDDRFGAVAGGGCDFVGCALQNFAPSRDDDA
jgi:hypothetical protein